MPHSFSHDGSDRVCFKLISFIESKNDIVDLNVNNLSVNNPAIACLDGDNSVQVDTLIKRSAVRGDT